MNKTPEQEAYERGYAACGNDRDDFWKQIADIEPIKQGALRLILNQGLCPQCKEIVKRFIHD